MGRDADGVMTDPDGKDDCFAPPDEPCECYCLHCGRVFMSDLMWFQRVVGARDGFHGFWMCPTPNCGGAGFTFDIFPTDPEHPANESWDYSDDGEEEADDESDELEWQDEWADDGGAGAEPKEWDPAETEYAKLD